MKHRIFISVIAAASCMVLALPMGGCQTVGGLFHPGTSPTASSPVSTAVSKALLVAETAADQMARDVEILVKNGALKGTAATTVQGILHRAGDVLDLAEKANALGNAGDVSSQLAQFADLMAAANAIIHGQSPTPPG